LKTGTALILALGLAASTLTTAGAEEITVAGSTTVQPLAEKLAEAYEAATPGVSISISGGGSSVGVTSAGNGTTDIGTASREVTEAELDRYPDMVVHVIARDGIAIITHPGIGITNLSKAQVKDIFAGDISSWSEVGGPDERIVVVSREEGSGTRAAFEELVLANAAMITGMAILQPSNGAVMTTVSTTPYSISYVSFGYLDESVTALSVNGTAPTVENAVAGRYPVVRPLCFLTDGQPGTAVQGWLDFIMGPEGQAIVVDEGYLAVR
jgi:phosphate transport system substrate-binding protein